MNENLIPNCLCLNQLLTVRLLCSPRILFTNTFQNPDCQKYWQLSLAEQHFPQQNCDPFKALCFGLWHIAWIPRIYSSFVSISDANCATPQWHRGYPAAEQEGEIVGREAGWAIKCCFCSKWDAWYFAFDFFCNVCVRGLVVRCQLNNITPHCTPKPLCTKVPAPKLTKFSWLLFQG